MMTRRGILRSAGGTAMLVLIPSVARAAATAVRVYTGPAFGSAWRLVLPDTGEARLARARLEAVVDRVDALMSPFRLDSELGRFNAAGSVAASPETKLVAGAALQLAHDSGGAFDPTAAPLVRRYGFGSPAISADRPSGCFRDLSITGNVVNAARPGLSLDLCGIAKGFALDEIVRALDGLDFLAELGGEVAARGRHPSGRPWRIGIERPGSAVLQRIVDADAWAIATSGDNAQGYSIGGRRYAHVVDPRRQAPADGAVASVSVRAASGMLADGLATAAMVLGAEAAYGLLRNYDAAALFLVRRAGGLEEVDINGFMEGGAA